MHPGRMLDDPSDHHNLTLEPDPTPVPGFREGFHDALAVVPMPSDYQWGRFMGEATIVLPAALIMLLAIIKVQQVKARMDRSRTRRKKR